MSGFDLRQLVREELETSPVADPHIVAEHVSKQVPDASLRDVCRELLPALVLKMIHEQRGTLPTTRAPATRVRSRKCDDQAWYRRMLRQRIEIGGTDGREWKFLGDCTRGELLKAAEFRREQAAANVAAAEQLERLAEKMRTFRKKTVADLDAGLLAEVFG